LPEIICEGSKLQDVRMEFLRAMAIICEHFEGKLTINHDRKGTHFISIEFVLDSMNPCKKFIYESTMHQEN